MKILALLCVNFILFDLYNIHAYTITNIPKTLFRIPLLSSKLFKIRSEKSSNNIHEEGDNPQIVSNKKDNNTNLIIEYIIDAIDEGKVEELNKKGFSVTKLTNEYETELEYKLNDPEIQAKILGDFHIKGSYLIILDVFFTND